MQGEHAAWSARNFGSSLGKPHRGLLGFVEEVGEFVEAAADRDDDSMFDALGDALIFASDFCSKAGFDLAEVVSLAQEGRAGHDLNQVTVPLGKLCHHFLKDEQGIRSNEDHRDQILIFMAEVVRTMWDHYDEARRDKSMTIDEVVRVTWQEVRKRDWVADPVRGGRP